MIVRIYGCGSIGNHLAYGCRQKNWAVEMCDIDPQALERTEKLIYPERYGKWDKEIKLSTVSDLEKTALDIVIIGTPPSSHLEIALDVLKTNPPRIMLIEKPLTTPDLDDCDELLSIANNTETRVLVGYNHGLTENTKMVEQLLEKGVIEEPLTVSARVREHWSGIFLAHPWLSGPADCYLGSSRSGGGALAEHSHAIHIWQHVSHLLNKGRINEVSAMMDWVDLGGLEYDQLCLLHVKTEGGMVGEITQDVLTEPAEKYFRIQAKRGFIEWFVNKSHNKDAVRYWSGDENAKEIIFSKTRPDDFANEINHIEKLLTDSSIESPISVNRGLDVMLVIAAAHMSSREKRRVHIDYDKGYNLSAITY